MSLLFAALRLSVFFAADTGGASTPSKSLTLKEQLTAMTKERDEAVKAKSDLEAKFVKLEEEKKDAEDDKEKAEEEAEKEKEARQKAEDEKDQAEKEKKDAEEAKGKALEEKTKAVDEASRAKTLAQEQAARSGATAPANSAAAEQGRKDAGAVAGTPRERLAAGMKVAGV